MEELDRWAVTRLNALIERCFAGYDGFDFNTVTHAVNDFCVVDMSNFYLDIIKDRLYCEARDGLRRRSAQTALFLILDTMTRIMAPILAYTADEIWQSMPHRAEDDARNVVFNEMHRPFAAYALTDAEMARWDKLIALRNDVNAVLEEKRAAKLIGKSLEAKVTLCPADADARAVLDALQGLDLAELFIVSAVAVADAAPAGARAGESFPGIAVAAEPAPGDKCPRCWVLSTQADADGLCPRCAKVVSFLK
jgi:isoleucyl-tRNA synthetase